MDKILAKFTDSGRQSFVRATRQAQGVKTNGAPSACDATHLPLPVEALNRELKISGETGNLRVTLQERSANPAFAKAATEEYGFQETAIGPVFAALPQSRDMPAHAPPLPIHRDGEIAGGVIRGCRAPEQFRR